MVSWKVPQKYYFDKLVKSQNNFYLLLMSKLMAISYIIKYLFFMSLFKHIDIEKKILWFFQNPYVSHNFSSDSNDLLIEMFLMLT